MSAMTGIDVRYPIGALFSALGILIGGYGIATLGDGRYDRLGGVNVNLWWGIVMLIFGIACIALARRADATPTVRPATESPEGRAIEQTEKQRGVERNP